MYSKREAFVLATLAAHLCRRYSRDRHVMRTLFDWLEEHEHRLRFDVDKLDQQLPLDGMPRRGMSRRQAAAVADAVAAWKTSLGGESASPFEHNAETFARAVGLPTFEQRLFVTLGLVASLDAFADLARELAERSDIQLPELIALMLDTDVERVARAVEKGPLVDAGLLAVGDDGEAGMYVPWDLRQALAQPKKTLSEIEERLIGAVEPPLTTAADHDHHAKDRDFVLSLVKGALAEGAKGVNILIHGATGTGKTEFCRMVAKELGMQLYSVGEKAENGDEPERQDRLSALLLAQSLMAERKDALLLFDEMDDILVEPPNPFAMFMPDMNITGPSKVFLHRMLENNRTPTLWTLNSIGGLDEALMRRMTYSFEMRVPPVAVRARIWARIAESHKFDLEVETAEELARQYDVSPALIENAMRAAILTKGGVPALKAALDQSQRVVFGQVRPPSPLEAPFDPALVNADVDMVNLAERLTRPDLARNFSLLMTGPPGTGKTAYVRYLAERLGMDVLHKRASDLISMWVGQTEQQIAEAFREAADMGKFLVFDEADSMLYDRRNAVRSFEVSQVNEMLTWMESHPLPFACTSNLVDGIDQAAMRRFTFKTRVDYLKTEQATRAFESFFDTSPPERLAKLDMLTPGDFAVVKKKLRFLGEADGEDLVDMLRLECEAKADYKSGAKVGFRKS